MQNVEYKAELRDIRLARAICRSLGATRLGTLEQTDTYFRIPDARLKKRETVGLETQYIFYERRNTPGAKLSRYVLYSEPEALERFGTTPLPVWVVVKKKRELFTSENTRIHLDTVEGLGRFFELEVVISRRRNVAASRTALARLRREFAPALGEPISMSYSDLIAAEGEDRAKHQH